MCALAASLAASVGVGSLRSGVRYYARIFFLCSPCDGDAWRRELATDKQQLPTGNCRCIPIAFNAMLLNGMLESNSCANCCNAICASPNVEYYNRRKIRT